jgi:hypothetical protein
MRRKQNKRNGHAQKHTHPAHTGTDILRARPTEYKQRQRTKGETVIT